MSSDSRMVVRPIDESVSRIEFTLRQVRVGKMQIFDHLEEENNQGCMTARGLSLKVGLSPNGPATCLVLQMKDILSATVCLQSVLPFLSLQLRHSASARVAAKLRLGQDEFDTRSRQEDKKLFTIFFADQTRENVNDEAWINKLTFFLSNFKKCQFILLNPEEASAYLDQAGAKVPRLLHDTGHNIFKAVYEEALAEFNHSAEFGAKFIFLFAEYQLELTQKLVSYYLDVKLDSIDETLSVTDPEDVLKMFNHLVRSKQDVMLEIAKYKTSLKCSNCGKFAKLKCSWCQGRRYCASACQDVDREQHQRQCQQLKEAAKAKKDYYSTMAKRHFPCPGGPSFTKYNHRVKQKFNQLVRDAIEEDPDTFWKFSHDSQVCMGTDES